ERNFAVDRLVLDQQHPLARPVAARHFLRWRTLRRRAGGLRRVLPEPGGKPEGAADPLRAADADRSPHHLGELRGDRQPEAGAAVFAGRRTVGLLEGREQLAERRLGNADARILDLEAQQDLALIFLVDAD